MCLGNNLGDDSLVPAHSPASDNLFHLRSVAPDARVDVDGEQGGGRVEDGRQ